VRPAASAPRRRAGQRGLAGGPQLAHADALNSTLAQLLMVMERLDERIGAAPARPPVILPYSTLSGCGAHILQAATAGLCSHLKRRRR